MPNKTITLSEVLSQPKKETTDWIRTRAVIDFYSNPVEVLDNGELVGYLTNLLVKMDNVSDPDETLKYKNSGFLIEGYYFPKTHLHSFGRYTGLIILYSPNLKEAVIDPNQKPWHYEI